MARPRKRDQRPKTGGRKAGTPNKISQRQIKMAEESGETPLEFLLRMMRNDENELRLRIDAAKHASKYVHQELKAVEVTGPGGSKVNGPQINIVRTPAEKQITNDEQLDNKDQNDAANE